MSLHFVVNDTKGTLCPIFVPCLSRVYIILTYVLYMKRQIRDKINQKDKMSYLCPCRNRAIFAVNKATNEGQMRDTIRNNFGTTLVQIRDVLLKV